jgi:dCTP deaminase
MILVDHQIDQLCRGEVPWYIRLGYLFTGHWIGNPLPMVEQYDPRLINPASLDIRIGTTAKLRTVRNVIDGGKVCGYAPIDLSSFDVENPYWLPPGDRLLVSSLETFNLPEFLCAQFRLKSSRGREWYEHMEAGFCDPQWHGSKLTMEIINMDAEPLPFYPGLRMGQLIFSLTLGVPRKTYAQTGRYNGDKTVMESKG